MKRVFAGILTLAAVLSFASCAGGNGKETTAAPATQADASTVPESATASGTEAVESTTVPGESTTAGSTAPGESTTAGSNTPVTPVNKVPATKAEILAAYTAVMNKAKAVKPAYTSYEYQFLPDTEKYKDNFIVRTLTGVVNRFMTSEEEAKKNPKVFGKNSDMKANFPVKEADFGCMLTDMNAVRSAKCEALANGNYKITFLLKDEKNPERYREGMKKAPSATGNVFITLSPSDIKPNLEKPFVKAVVKEGKYDLYYHDCKATLVYNPKTNQIVTVDHVTYTTLDIGGKVFGKYYSAKTELEMVYSAFGFQY